MHKENFRYVDMMGYRSDVSEATVVYGDHPGDAHVLVDAATRDRMALDVIEAGILDHQGDIEWALRIRHAPAAPPDYPGLFDVTEIGGGWLHWYESFSNG